MIGLGAIKFQADGKYDAWAQVRTEAGEIGYSFAGFLLEEDEDYNSEGTSDSGFVLLKSVPNLEKDLKTAVEIFEGYSDLKSTEELECEMDCQVYAYERVFEKDGRKYFLIKKQNKEYGINYMEQGSLEEGWVDSAYVEASGHNLYDYSRTKIKNKDIQMISEYLHSKDSIKSSFDINIAEKISTLDDSGIYYVVNYFDRDTDFVPFERSSGVFFIHGKDIRMILNHFDSVVYQDINNDGVGEWLTTSSGRSDYSYILYGNIKGSMRNLIQVFESEYEGCSYSVMDGKQVNLKQAEEYSQKKCSLKIEDNGTVTIDHGLGILKFSFNGTKLIRI
ncbi:MAG: hypothetical protein JJT78_08615 [Leptospira sp.]|nr:hypothetical protein [Leptospira sp.]